mgnify:CR=1 FL=1
MKKYRRPYRIKRKKPIWKKRFFGLSILLLIISGGIFYLIFFASFFQIKEIKISGNEKVLTSDIENVAWEVLFSEGESIFILNPEKIKHQVLFSLPQVSQANVKREWPDGLIIEVRERKPAATFCQNGNCFFIDKEGIIFEPAPENSQLIKIFTEIGSLQNFSLGKKVLEKNIISSILKIESKLKEDLKITPESALLVSDERLNVKTFEGWEIYFDPTKDLNWQLTKLKAVLEEEISPEKRKNLDYIELRFGNLAPYKYR